MTAELPIAEFEISSGAQRGSRLTLYPSRLAYQGGDAMETVSLVHLASVGVAFERDARKFNWAIALLVLALILLSVSGPISSGIASVVVGVKENAARESADSVLLTTFSALGAVARLLPALAAVLAATAVALGVYFWLGLTTLALGFAAGEREYSVRGRNPLLIQFAEVVAAQLALRKG